MHQANVFCVYIQYTCVNGGVLFQPGDPVAFQNRARRPKWKKPAPQTTGLVVKDVVCLPRDYYTAQIERCVRVCLID